ncbi:MAG: alpha,alpha-trehalase TreF [Candidatus Saccharimonas sp.]
MLRRLFAKKPKIIIKNEDKLKAALVNTAGALRPAAKSPDEELHELFEAVQSQFVFSDSKTFVDMIPRKKARILLRLYLMTCKADDFDIHQFVEEHFTKFMPTGTSNYSLVKGASAREHVRLLWPTLVRKNLDDVGSLIALPKPYVVPGGRFSEQFYWDSYFIMLGLSRDDHWDLIGDMVGNFAYMLRRFGRIPTANRTYFLSRSQPPFFASMVELLSQHRGRAQTYARYLPSMLAEYRFWMKGRRLVDDHPDFVAYARVVCTENGGTLNRYFDNKQTPRPESSREDISTAKLARSREPNQVYLDLRAGAESGWDFSSRWLKSADNLRSIRTTDIVPIDLNCLLYQLEESIAEAYRLIKQPILATRFRAAANRRAELIRHYFWSTQEKFFLDYDFRTGRRVRRPTLAACYALYVNVATPDQAAAVAKRLERDFLKPGGLVTSLDESGQQWDTPNGWAPLHWITIQGLRNYGYNELADEIRNRWLATNELVFAKHKKMVEKYDVITREVGNGGEYPLQDGFGWTNGVYAALKDEQEGRV